MKVKQVYNLNTYTPPLWVRIMLYFKPLLEAERNDTLLFYKMFRGCMYVYASWWFIRQPAGGTHHDN